MKRESEHAFVAYPRRFEGYRWYRPLFVGALHIVFVLIAMLAVGLAVHFLFGASKKYTGYDGMDFCTAAGAFENAAMASAPLLCMILAAPIVRDRPVSSCFSSMGGWRWCVFLKTFAAGLVIVALPIAAFNEKKRRQSSAPA